MAGGPRILVAGMGSVLHGDDGFGVAVAQALAARALPPGVEVVEVGTGGIHLVQELLTGYDALVIADAVDRAAAPGTLFVLEPGEAYAAGDPEPDDGSAHLTDMHYAVPSRVLILAKALGVLPGRVLIVGCQGGATDGLDLELSGPVRQAVARAVATIEAIVGELAGGGSPALGRRDADG